MKKIAKILGVFIIALALFSNLNTNSENSEAAMLAFTIAEAQTINPGGEEEVKCRWTGIKTDYCYVEPNFKFKCANNDEKDNCDDVETEDPFLL